MLFPKVHEWVVGLVLEALGLGVGFQSKISAPGRTDGAGLATMGSPEPAGVSGAAQGRRCPSLTPCRCHNPEVMQGRAHRWEGWDGTHRDTGRGCQRWPSPRPEQRSVVWLRDSAACSHCFSSPFEDALGNRSSPEDL